MKPLPQADEMSYWKTSRSAPGVWMDRAAAQVERAGGQVMGHARGTDAALGRAAYMMEFEVQGERFRVVWPVLPHGNHKGGDVAARRQAATMLHHDVKARCVSAQVLGFRRAFFAYLLLPDGRPAADHADESLVQALPQFPERRMLEAPSA